MTAAGTFDNTGNTGAQICVYCHTPHNANLEIDGPLWNRNVAVGTYTMYNGGAPSGSIKGTFDASPNPETLICLGCHDGVSAVDSIVNLPGRDPDVTWATGGQSLSDIASYAVLGSDLSDDHPVSITFEPTLNAGLAAMGVPEAAGLKFFGPGANKVECATCHNVHGTGHAQLLRVSSDGSLICLTCHLM